MTRSTSAGVVRSEHQARVGTGGDPDAVLGTQRSEPMDRPAMPLNCIGGATPDCVRGLTERRRPAFREASGARIGHLRRRPHLWSQAAWGSWMATRCEKEWDRRPSRRASALRYPLAKHILVAVRR
jgi:hypothetical protein